MDIVDFIEKLYHINLMEYQKQLVRNIYHALENGEEIKWLVPLVAVVDLIYQYCMAQSVQYIKSK